MPSLRKRVTSYFRQLSFHNEPREKRLNFIENTFINKYLNGEIRLKQSPPIIYGKNATDLPNYELNLYKTGSKSIVACCTGPGGGLTTVKRKEKHLCVQGQDDIDFIDTQDEEIEEGTQSVVERNNQVPPPVSSNSRLDNTTMVIKVAGQEYLVTNRKRSHSKSHSLGSISDFKIEIDKTKVIAIATNNATTSSSMSSASTTITTTATLPYSSKKPPAPAPTQQCDSPCDNNTTNAKKCVRLDNLVADDDAINRNETTNTSTGPPHSLSKSKSDGNPFGHKKKREGKITRLQHRPTGGDSAEMRTATTKSSTALPDEWDVKSDFAYGISDSLYDRNLISKTKNGDPIADCYGIIARHDSAIIAVADGVNWGEKASIAAKSAIHGCLHYLNETIFMDSRPFDALGSGATTKTTTTTTGQHETRITNTREVFVCLLRAFNCAHDLILENNGMLTTLTVAIVLPLKQHSSTVRRDNNDDEGGGAARPSSNETSAATAGENYICCVCNVGDTLAYVYSHKYGIRELTKGSHDINCNRDMRDALGALGPVDGIKPELSNLTLSITRIQKGDIVMVASDGLTDNFDPNVCKFTVNCEVEQAFRAREQHQQQQKAANKASTAAPVKPPRKNLSNRSSSTSSANSSATPTPQSSIRRGLATTKKSVTVVETAQQDNTNPLIAQFLKDNPLDRRPGSGSSSTPSSSRSSHAKPIRPMKSASAKHIQHPRDEKTTAYSILRSKTSLDFRAKTIDRNADGLPYITPLQRYELTLLLIEDILKRGISGKEGECLTARKLCENLVRFTMSITNAKRRTLEDTDLYYNNRNGVLVEVSHVERKNRRKQALEKVQNLPGKLDHVTVAAYNVGNTTIHYANY